MKRNMARLTILTLLTLLLGLMPISGGLVLAHEGELEFRGEGEGIAADIEYIGHDGVVRAIRSNLSAKGGLDLRGHEFTFDFRAEKEDGEVEGFMQLDDPQLGLSIFATDFDIAEAHPKHKIPVGGFVGPDAVDMKKGTTVYINGVLQPGWRFDNGPMFVGKDSDGEDVFVVCFELRQPIDGKLVKTHQWHAFVTEGKAEIERPDGTDQVVKIR